MIEAILLSHLDGVLLRTGATSLTGIMLTLGFVGVVNLVIKLIKGVFN